MTFPTKYIKPVIDELNQDNEKTDINILKIQETIRKEIKAYCPNDLARGILMGIIYVKLYHDDLHALDDNINFAEELLA